MFDEEFNEYADRRGSHGSTEEYVRHIIHGASHWGEKNRWLRETCCPVHTQVSYDDGPQPPLVLRTDPQFRHAQARPLMAQPGGQMLPMTELAMMEVR